MWGQIIKLPLEQLWLIQKFHRKFEWLIVFYLWCFLTAAGVVFNYCKLKLKVERKNFLTNAFKAWCSKSQGTFRKHLKLSKQKKKKNLCVKVADTFFFFSRVQDGNLYDFFKWCITFCHHKLQNFIRYISIPYWGLYKYFLFSFIHIFSLTKQFKKRLIIYHRYVNFCNLRRNSSTFLQYRLFHICKIFDIYYWLILLK